MHALRRGAPARTGKEVPGGSRRSRGQDHHDAEYLLTEIRGGGRDAAKQLRRLLDLKDTAHYGLIHVSGAKLTSALGQARVLVQFADAILKG